MKKLSTLILMLTLFVSIKISAQASGDVTMILQKCIDLPDLQQFYPVNVDGSHSKVYVLQHGVSFPLSTEITRFGKKVQFITKNDLATGEIKSYFLFWEFKVEQNTADIDYVFNYPGSDEHPGIQHIILTLKKNDGIWNVVSTKIEGR
jgi:hypothetical protein